MKKEGLWRVAAATGLALTLQAEQVRAGTTPPPPTPTVAPVEPPRDQISIDILPKCIWIVICGADIENTTKQVATAVTSKIEATTQPESTQTPEDLKLRNSIEIAKTGESLHIEDARIGYVVRVRDNYYATLMDSQGEFVGGITNANTLYDLLRTENKLGDAKAGGVWKPDVVLDELDFGVLSEKDIAQLPAVLELQKITDEGKEILAPKKPSLLTRETAERFAKYSGETAMRIVMALIDGIESAS